MYLKIFTFNHTQLIHLHFYHFTRNIFCSLLVTKKCLFYCTRNINYSKSQIKFSSIFQIFLSYISQAVNIIYNDEYVFICFSKIFQYIEYFFSNLLLSNQVVFILIIFNKTRTEFALIPIIFIIIHFFKFIYNTF